MKKSENSSVLKQAIVSEDQALNNIRSAMSKLYHNEETILDIKAMAFIEKVITGKPQMIVNAKNNHCIVFQLHK